MELPPLAEVSLFFRHLLPSSLPQSVFPLPLFIAISIIFGLLISLLLVYIFRNSMSILILGSFAAIIALVIFSGALLLMIDDVRQEVRIVGSDYATKTSRIAALRKYGPDIVVQSSSDITDTAFDLQYYVNLKGQSGFEHHIAIKVAPDDIIGWTKDWEHTKGENYLPADRKPRLTDFNIKWPVVSSPQDYSIRYYGWARVYQQEGIILIFMQGSSNELM